MLLLHASVIRSVSMMFANTSVRQSSPFPSNTFHASAGNHLIQLLFPSSSSSTALPTSCLVMPATCISLPGSFTCLYLKTPLYSRTLIESVHVCKIICLRFVPQNKNVINLKGKPLMFNDEKGVLLAYHLHVFDAQIVLCFCNDLQRAHSV